ncbi:HU family DNA-binding protein [Deinococcus aluminii]
MHPMTKKSTKAPAQKPAEAAPAQEQPAAGKLGKTQLVERVAEQAGLTKKQAGEAVDALMDAVVDAIKQGQTVGLPGLGTLSVKATAARTGVKPGTSERINIPAGKKVAFKVASTLKTGLQG